MLPSIIIKLHTSQVKNKMQSSLSGTGTPQEGAIDQSFIGTPVANRTQTSYATPIATPRFSEMGDSTTIETPPPAAAAPAKKKKKKGGDGPGKNWRKGLKGALVPGAYASPASGSPGGSGSSTPILKGAAVGAPPKLNTTFLPALALETRTPRPRRWNRSFMEVKTVTGVVMRCSAWNGDRYSPYYNFRHPRHATYPSPPPPPAKHISPLANTVVTSEAVTVEAAVEATVETSVSI